MSLSDKLLARGVPLPAKNSNAGKALYEGGVPLTPELQRILLLPRRVLDFSKVEDLSPVYVHTEGRCKVYPDCRLCASDAPVKLRPVQSVMLWEAHRMSGLFAAVAVGGGKTIVSLLLHDVLEATTTVLLLKPSLRVQLVHEWQMYARHFTIPPVKWSKPAAIATSNGKTPGVWLVSYHELSNAKSADILEVLKPDLIVADEAHLIRRLSSARTKRWRRYHDNHPECRFVAMTGTPTRKSIRDYAPFVELALGKNSPLPLARYGDLKDWSAALDEPIPGVDPMPPGKLMLLCEPGESVREGYRRRLVESYGVVATSTSDCDALLTVRARFVSKPRVVTQALSHLENFWVWDGNEIEDALAYTRVARQLACGFYYRWEWPGGVVDKEWLEARNAWHKEVRDYLSSRARPGMDSPLFLANAAERGEWKSATWRDWKGVKARKPPPVSAIWIDDFLCRDAISWANKGDEESGKGGIIWYDHAAVGEMIAELSDFPFFGPGSADRLKKVDASKHPSIICSIDAHVEGSNLQAYSRCLVTSPPAAGLTWEQLIGREHRPAQLADEVFVDWYAHTQENVKAFDSAIRQAQCTYEREGQEQKLLLATHLNVQSAD